MKEIPLRERQLNAMGTRMGVLGGLLAAVAAGLTVVGQRGQGDLHGFILGMGTGMLGILPLFFALMTLQMYRKMDEYARQQLTQAASVAFLVTMLVSGSLIALQAALHFSTPAWVLYVVGMGAWLVATLAQTFRTRTEGARE